MESFMKFTRLIATTLLILLSGCSSATSTAEPSPVIPTVTEMAMARPATPTPVAAAKPEVTLETYLNNGQSAFDSQDYESATDQFMQAYLLDSSNQTVAKRLAEAYWKWGDMTLTQALTNSDILRSALEYFHQGSKVAPHTEEIAQKLSVDTKATEMLYDALQLQGEFQALRDNGGEAQQLEEKLGLIQQKIDGLRELREDLPQIRLLQYRTWLAAAKLKEQAGDDAGKRARKKEIWQVALDYCRQARDLAGADTPESQEAIECIQRLEKKMIDPTPTPTPQPPPAPARAPAAPEARLRFYKEGEFDDPTCITVQIRGIAPVGWYFSIDGLDQIKGFFNGQDARACGLGNRQEYTFTVKNRSGQPIRGGEGVPTRGSAVMIANWP
jgi:hypothetical protein